MTPRPQTRREFLRQSLTLLAAGASAPLFLTRTASAIEHWLAVAGVKSLPGMPDGRVLVVVQLGGGNDGLNTVIPYNHDAYYRARPNLGVTADKVLKLTDQIGLHPALAPMRKLCDAGHVAVVQGVGYPNPDRSHFQSMDIWHAGAPGGKVQTYGWLGRYLDSACPGCTGKGTRTQINPLAGVSLGGYLPLALKSNRGLSVAVSNPESFRWLPLPNDDRAERWEQDTFRELNRPRPAPTRDPQLARVQFLARVATNADTSSERIRDALGRQRGIGATDYPANGLGRQLQTVSQLMTAGLETKVYFVSMGGFDTHANQAGRHEQLLGQLAEALAAFGEDLQKRGELDRVLVLTFSEFGRRVAENASGGTDHGAAAPLFVLGGKVRGGVYGAHPGLEKGQLDRGDLKFHTDFRSVYATVLERWLRTPAASVLGEGFQPLKFI